MILRAMLMRLCCDITWHSWDFPNTCLSVHHFGDSHTHTDTYIIYIHMKMFPSEFFDISRARFCFIFCFTAYYCGTIWHDNGICLSLSHTSVRGPHPAARRTFGICLFSLHTHIILYIKAFVHVYMCVCGDFFDFPVGRIRSTFISHLLSLQCWLKVVVLNCQRNPFYPHTYLPTEHRANIYLTRSFRAMTNH